MFLIIIDERDNMNTKSFNRNYRYNSKHNMAKINKTVDEIMREDVTSKPFDFLFRSNSRNYPEATHKLLELPGTFEKEEDTAVFVRDNSVLQMDYCETAQLNGSTVIHKILYDVEHHVHELPDAKVPIIYNYCFNTSLRLKNPCYPFVATNEDYPPKLTYLVDGFDFVIYFRVFNKKKDIQTIKYCNSKRL